MDQGLVMEADAVPAAGVCRPLSDVRTGVCDRVRSQIASGDYETDAKVDASLPRLSAEMVDAPEDDDIAGFDDDDDDEDDELYGDDDDDDDSEDDEEPYGAGGGVSVEALAGSDFGCPTLMN